MAFGIVPGWREGLCSQAVPCDGQWRLALPQHFSGFSYMLLGRRNDDQNPQGCPRVDFNVEPARSLGACTVEHFSWCPVETPP